MRITISLSAIVMTLAITTSPANAISRYQSTNLGCGEIQSIILREGAAIFRYPSKRKPDLTLYDRYVRDASQCNPHEVTEQVVIPSHKGACPVLHCIEAPDICDLPFPPASCRR